MDGRFCIAFGGTDLHIHWKPDLVLRQSIIQSSCCIEHDIVLSCRCLSFYHQSCMLR